MTTWAKKLGGPKRLIAGIAIGGYAVIRLGEAGVKKLIKIVESNPVKREKYQSKVFFVVHTESKSNEGVAFKVGDKISILEIDKDSVLIEIIDDANSPYFVSADFLKSISDFDF